MSAPGKLAAKQNVLVCGTDFSVHAVEAATVAAAFARLFEFRLVLVHAVEPGGAAFLKKRLAREWREELAEKLANEAERLRATGVEVSEQLVDGAAPTLLAKAAKDAGAQMIVVSSLGQVAPRQWLVGSVAERTAQSATVPTLVVREHEPLLAWARGKRNLKVLLGYDFSLSSDAALHWVSQFFQARPCALTVACVVWLPGETRRLGMGGEGSVEASAAEVRQLVERDLRARCLEVLGKRKVNFQVASSWGGEQEELLRAATEAQADLVVVGTNQRRGLDRFWLGSVSRHILHHATANVACVPMADHLLQPDGLPKFKRVLVPVDLSRLAEKAVCHGVAVAQRGADVCVLHVIPPGPGYKPGSDPATAREDTRRTRLRHSLSERLQPIVYDKAQAKGVRVRVEIVEHPRPAEAICQSAERLGADIICLGSRGRTGLKKQWLGSVSEGVMRETARPVLVVR
ncbi:MAG: universal stress protein [Verrucomicrobiia bacterium]